MQRAPPPHCNQHAGTPGTDPLHAAALLEAPCICPSRAPGLTCLRPRPTLPSRAPAMVQWKEQRGGSEQPAAGPRGCQQYLQPATLSSTPLRRERALYLATGRPQWSGRPLEGPTRQSWQRLPRPGPALASPCAAARFWPQARATRRARSALGFMVESHAGLLQGRQRAPVLAGGGADAGDAPCSSSTAAGEMRGRGGSEGEAGFGHGAPCISPRCPAAAVGMQVGGRLRRYRKVQTTECWQPVGYTHCVCQLTSGHLLLHTPQLSWRMNNVFAAVASVAPLLIPVCTRGLNSQRQHSNPPGRQVPCVSTRSSMLLHKTSSFLHPCMGNGCRLYQVTPLQRPARSSPQVPDDRATKRPSLQSLQSGSLF